MVRRVKDLEQFAIRSSDGHEFGTIQDFYFDDERWTVRYVVVRSGTWFSGRLVLLSPMTIDHVHWARSTVVFALTRAQIEAAPDANLAQPMSRRWEAAYAQHYAIPYYWAGTGIWGDWPTPSEARLAIRQPAPVEPGVDGEHLRSVQAVTGYHLHALDGEIGHADDYLVDDRTWTIRYLRVDTRNWIRGRAVLVPADQVVRIDWPRRLIYVRLTREEVEESRDDDLSQR